MKALQTLKVHVITYYIVYLLFDLDAKVVIFRILPKSGSEMGDLTPHWLVVFRPHLGRPWEHMLRKRVF